jgi:methyl-accepting chemotaxis protein
MANELEERLQFYDLPVHSPAMSRVGRRIAGHLDGALNRFYDRIAATPAISKLFSGRGHMDQAASAQKQHWTALFGQGLNEGYWKRANVIGTVHARIGLEPKWYVGGYSMILDDLVRAMAAPGLARFLPWRRRQAEDLALLVRASLLDMDIALSTYFAQNDRVREESLEKMGDALAKLAAGDLTSRMSGLPAEYARAESDFNRATEALEKTISGVVMGIESITGASAEIRSASEDLAIRNEQQAANVEESAAAMGEVTASVQDTAMRSAEAQQQITNAHGEATEGGAVVSRAIEAMAAIEHSAHEISQIINLIDGIAFQTNLLALNAGVEAARAGDSGRGFAVVANEVRALAQRSADAARDIKALITNSSQQVSTGVELVGETGALLEKIVSGVGDIRQLVDSIAGAARMQAGNLQQVNLSVSEMDKMTQQNAAMVEQSTAASRALAEEAASLAQLVAGFHAGGRAKPAATPRRRAAPAQVSGNLALKATDSDWSEF